MTEMFNEINKLFKKNETIILTKDEKKDSIIE